MRNPYVDQPSKWQIVSFICTAIVSLGLIWVAFKIFMKMILWGASLI